MFELYLLTFNCARNLVSPDALAPSIFEALPPSAPVPDLVAVSLQEISPIAYSFLGGSYLAPYLERLTATVQLAATLRSSHGSEQLQHVATRNLGMTALMIFAKPQFAARIQWIQSAGTGVGFWNMGNKGAVAMRLGLACPGSRHVLGVTLAAAHLAPDECKVEARNKDWETIVRNLVFVNSDTSGKNLVEDVPLLAASSDAPVDGSGLFAPGNHVFFAGDLNYRTHENPPGPNAYQAYPPPTPNLSPRHFLQLLNTDQLTREKEAGRTLHNLRELPINFPPTYKYSMREDSCSDASRDRKRAFAKHRYPSWCDRILFLPQPTPSKLEPLLYTALPVQPTSDHRPVALSLRIDDTRVEVGDDLDTQLSVPFPINPSWKTRQDAARRLEVLVGIFSYLGLTKKGNAIMVAFVGTAFALFWMASWFRN